MKWEESFISLPGSVNQQNKLTKRKAAVDREVNNLLALRADWQTLFGGGEVCLDVFLTMFSNILYTTFFELLSFGVVFIISLNSS